MSDLSKNTPLIDFHRSRGGRIVEFAGWNMPVQYAGIIEEHKAVRNSAGLFDASHMGEAFVSGSDALEFLNYALSNDFSGLENGAARYGVLCNPDGGAADDVIVYKMIDGTYMVVLNASNTAKDMRLLKERAAGLGGRAFNVEVEDISDSFALLALQGPRSPEVMKAVFNADFSGLKRFHFTSDARMIISRTGYTGSDGYEIFCPPEDAVALAEKLSACEGVSLCGLGARDSLRVEACYPLYGHELSDSITPLEAGLGWAVKLGKDFVGRDALARQAADGVKRKVAWFKTEGRRIPRDGVDVFSNGEKVGKVLSGAWSGTWECPIGSALVEAQKISEGGLYVDIRGSKINLEIREKTK